MAALFVMPYLGSAAVAASPKGVLRQTAVFFPVGNMVVESSDTTKAVLAAEQLTAIMQKGLAACPRYATVAYSSRLPSVKRLVDIELDGKKLTAGPFAGDPDAMKRAVSLAKTLSADVAITGTVDFYKFDPAKGEASITATVQVIDVKTGRSSDTTVTGRAAKGDAADATESTLAAAAVRDAGGKILDQVTGGQYNAAAQNEPVIVPPPTSIKKKSKTGWVPMLLLSLGVGLLLGGSGGGGGGGGSAAPPDSPPPIPGI